MEHTDLASAPELVGGVRRLVRAGVREALARVDLPARLDPPIPGGLLRTRMAAWLAQGEAGPVLEQACAAAELAHLATVCHDDLAGAGGPNPSAAVLVGDVLLCKALDLIVGLAGGRYILTFTEKVRETCSAAAERELLAAGGPIDERTALRVARGMGGGLFSFAAQVCDGKDPALSAALEEAGYRVGTACHLAGEGPADGDGLRREVARQCACALECLAAWPSTRRHMAAFLDQDFAPLLDAARR